MNLPELPKGAARTLFIYYRVPAHCTQDLGRQVLAMQARLRLAFPGLDTRLMQRADHANHADGTNEANEANGAASSSAHAELTWMEVYAHAQGISPSCEDALNQAASALMSQGMGTRHAEAFLSLMPS